MKAIWGAKRAMGDSFSPQNAFCHRIASSLPASANK